jgi:hypothetical protein
MIERLRCGFLHHSITHFVHVAILQLGAIEKIDELRPVRGHAARIGQQFLKCDFGELGIHHVLLRRDQIQFLKPVSPDPTGTRLRVGFE